MMMMMMMLIYFSNVRDNKIENIGQACFGRLANLNTL